MQTNVVINDELMEKAMRLSGLTTQKEVVDRALTDYIQQFLRKDLSELQGKIQFADNYDYKALREGR